MDNQTIILLLIIVIVVTTVPVGLLVFYFMKKEFKGQSNFFLEQAQKRNGKLKKWPPFGFDFKFQDSMDVRVYALQGSFYLKTKIDLPIDPGVIIARNFPYLGFLNKLGTSPGKKRISFNPSYDERYLVKAADETWVREVLSPELLQEMLDKGRITRLVIKKNEFLAAFLIMRYTEAEAERTDQSIEICLKMLQNISRFNGAR